MGRIYSSSKFVVYVNVALAPVLAALLIALIVYASFVSGKLRESPATIPALALSILVLGILAPIAYVTLKAASQIRVQDDSVVEFRGALSKILVNPAAITRIRASSWLRNSWVEVRHTKGRVLIYAPIDGFYEFLGWLKSKNPNVEIRWL